MSASESPSALRLLAVDVELELRRVLRAVRAHAARAADSCAASAQQLVARLPSARRGRGRRGPAAGSRSRSALPSSGIAGGANGEDRCASLILAKRSHGARRRRACACSCGPCARPSPCSLTNAMPDVLAAAAEAEAGDGEHAFDRVLLVARGSSCSTCSSTAQVRSCVAPGGSCTWRDQMPWSSSGRNAVGRRTNSSAMSADDQRR